MLAVPLVATLFWHGDFTRNDVIMTRHALIAYAVGLAGIILVKILAPGFYAKQDIRTPVKVGVAHARGDAAPQPRLRALARARGARALDLARRHASTRRGSGGS
jgi:hypothetical protein